MRRPVTNGHRALHPGQSARPLNLVGEERRRPGQHLLQPLLDRDRRGSGRQRRSGRADRGGDHSPPSIPTRYIGQTLTARADRTLVRFYHADSSYCRRAVDGEDSQVLVDGELVLGRIIRAALALRCYGAGEHSANVRDRGLRPLRRIIPTTI
jgi:hypothetical protein